MSVTYHYSKELSMTKFKKGEKVTIQKSCPPHNYDDQWVLNKHAKHGDSFIVHHTQHSSSAGEIIYYNASGAWYYRGSDLKLYNNFNDLPLFKEIVNE